MLKSLSRGKQAKKRVGIVDEYPYVVVRFLKPPYAYIGDYACVPNSWIRIRRPTDQKSIVAYPEESPSTTEMRIKNGDKPLERWRLYIAIIKFETHSYENAHEFIMKKLHNASTNRYSAVINTKNELMPATATNRYSLVLEKTKLTSPGLGKIKNKLRAAGKMSFNNTTSNSSKSPKHLSIESRTTTPSEFPGRVFPENVMKKTDGKEHQEQISQNVLPSGDDVLLKYFQLQRIPKKINGTKVNNPEAGSQNTIRTTLHASRNPLIFINQNCNDSEQPTESQLSIHRDNLRHIALTQGISNEGILNRTFTLDLPEPLTENLDFRSNVSLVIQNSANQVNQSSQSEVPQSSPANQDLQVSPTQKTPRQSSEVECAIPKPSFYSEITNNPVVCLNSAGHQDSTIEEIDSSEVNCIEQNVLDSCRTENEFSAVPNSLKNANDSDQFTKSSMQKDLPVVDIVTSSDALSTQDFDGDERSNYPEISSEEVLTVSSSSNEQAGQSGDPILNKVDVWADQLYDIFQKMKVDFSETCQIAHDMHKSLVQSYTVIECIADASKKLRDLKKSKVAAVTSGKVTTEVQQVAGENEIEMEDVENPDVNINVNNNKEVKRSKEKEDGDIDNDNDDILIGDNHNEDNGNSNSIRKEKKKKKNSLKTTRGNIRTFVLPPEYNPDDTRWTLKYGKNDPELNLVELVPQSNVFINSIRLAYCKQVSKDSKALARMLLVEIFSQVALSVCSLTGARANLFDITGTNVRPGLDEPARMAILSFVDKQALEKNWGAFDSHAITNTLRSKIQEVRAKHGKTA